VENVKVTATFAGQNFKTSTASLFQLVKPAASTKTVLSVSPSTATYGDAETLTATVSSAAGTPDGTVDFADGGVPLGSATLASGTASITVSAPGLAAGMHTLTATYSGNSQFAGSAGSKSFTIAQAQSSLALGSSQNPSLVGNSVTFTATVSSTSGLTPSGAVSFTAGTYTKTVQLAPGSSTASVTITFNAVGHVTVKAVYGGENFKTSSASLIQTVQNVPKTTTTLSVSPSSPTYGDAETLTATVSSASGTPDGTVSFDDGGVPLGSATLTNGVASITVSAPGLNAGVNTLTATYSGSAQFAASSGSKNVTIAQAASSLVLTSAQNPTPAGSNVVITANVTSPAGVPVGAVTFTTNTFSKTVQTVNGTASVTIPFPNAGNIKVNGVFAGQNFKTSTYTLTEIVQ
jgi:hypothetical protein